ncbi:AI-2E family transporter [Clostridium rectalis]|uniref:AI-2E family transporter n=1 Tax=Clostridium rectalis TaxID=2040295 RepID=UPI000F637D18|nr:AI-2E family transporter [Clostridium rectalis]
MKEKIKQNKKLIVFLIFMFVLVILILKVPIIRDIFKLIFISFIVAYVLKPLNNYLISKGVNKTISSVCIIVLLIVIFAMSIAFFIPYLFKESLNIGETISNIENIITDLYQRIKLIKNNKIFENILGTVYGKINIRFNKAFNSAFEGALKLGENILAFAIVPIITYYFLSDGKDISNRLINMFPVKSRKLVYTIVEDIDKMLGRYIVTQIILSMVVGGFTFLVLILLKVDFPLVLSLLNAFFNIIPYFGPLFGALPAILIALLKSPEIAFWTAIWLYAIQQIEGNIISPKFIGDNISMHPLIVILLLLIGGKIGGFVGMVLAVPIGVAIKVVYEDLNYYIF